MDLFMYSFIFCNKFILIRFVVDLVPNPGSLGVRQGYGLDGLD